MDTQKSNFHRNLLITLIVLFVLTLAVIAYAIWAAEQANMLGWEMLLNIPILSIPLVLIYGSVYVLLMGWHERSTLGKVSPRLAKIIHWAPADGPKVRVLRSMPPDSRSSGSEPDSTSGA